MLKIDLKKLHRNLYRATVEPAFVKVPPLPFLAIDGIGDPDGTAYQEAVSALYSVAYAVRFALKNAGIVEYPVAPLEGLWWAPGGPDITKQARSDWHWTMMIPQPPQVTAELVAQGITTRAEKKPSDALHRVQLRKFTEGRAVQILHIGPYAQERPAIERLLTFVAEQGHRVSGRHHEIYLSNPARTPQEKLRTIIRYPVTPIAPTG